MASEHGEQAGRPSHPLVGVATDGVGLGYQAMELVVEGLRESLRHQSRGGSAPRRGQAPAGPTVSIGADDAPRASGGGSGQSTPPSGLVGDVAGIIAELLSRAGAVADEMAQTLTEQSAQTGRRGHSVPELCVEAAAGAKAKLSFSVWNRSPTALRQVSLTATDLIGAGHRIPAKAVSFDPAMLSHVPGGRDVEVEVTVAVPARTPAGRYRGLVQAEPVDTTAVIELIVIAPRGARGSRTRGSGARSR